MQSNAKKHSLQWGSPSPSLSCEGLHANCRDAAFESLSESMFLPKNLPSTRNCEKSWEGYLKQTDLLKISYTEREKLQK